MGHPKFEMGVRRRWEDRVSMDLVALLRGTFGYSGFRENQEAVCRSVAEGRDVLLVMPTGAGKSLCYQLPAVARGGTGLVVSPLIALMDDQAGKLTAKGLKVARIHSGLPREAAREACRAYLDGALQFLFIAPERLRVPGFPEMLARRRPSLIAVDEAHCISGWGHDFRPDYRTLGDYLPLLRPAPVIALTATATPIVQKDIVAQLKLADPALYIHGFRRENLAIEVVEMSKPERAEFVAAFLEVEAGVRRSSTLHRAKQADWLAHRAERAAFRRLPTMPGSTRGHGSGCSANFLRGSWKWWWRPSRSGWGSTRRTSGRLSTRRCRVRWKLTTRRLAARVAMESRRGRSCSTALQIGGSTRAFSTAIIRRWKIWIGWCGF